MEADLSKREDHLLNALRAFQRLGEVHFEAVTYQFLGWPYLGDGFKQMDLKAIIEY